MLFATAGAARRRMASLILLAARLGGRLRRLGAACGAADGASARQIIRASLLRLLRYCCVRLPPWDAMLCYAMLCYAMLCYAMLCYAMLCYAMLCYAMLCYAMRRPTLACAPPVCVGSRALPRAHMLGEAGPAACEGDAGAPVLRYERSLENTTGAVRSAALTVFT